MSEQKSDTPKPQQCITWMRTFYAASQKGSFTGYFDIGKNNAFSDTADCLESLERALTASKAECEQLREELAKERALREKLQRGEYICPKCYLRKDGKPDSAHEF